MTSQVTQPSALFGRNPQQPLRPLAARGKGIWLWDSDGNGYIDAASGAIAVTSIGHGVEEVIDAMAEQARHFAYIPSGQLRHDVGEALAQELARLTPGDVNRAIFVSGGSEANETAIKLARQYQLIRGHPERHVVISRTRSYHGMTLGALSISGYAARRSAFKPLLLWEPQLAEANCYRCPFGLTYPGCDLDCAGDLERVIATTGVDKIAAVIAEPIIGAAGPGLTPPPGYFERLRAICDRHDILLIADEVITGLGRTGKNFGIDHWNVVPDIITTAKGLSGGYAALGAVLVSDRVAAAFEQSKTPFIHGFTFMEHPVACAAGLAVLRIIQRDRLIENAAIQGEYLFARLHDLAARNPLIGDIRGKGLLAGIELVADRATKRAIDPKRQLTQRLLAAARARGLLLYPGNSGDGQVSDQVLISPPLIVQRDDLDEIVARFALALDDIRPLAVAAA